MLRSNAVVELVWQDETGSRALTMLNVPSSSTYEDIDAAATALASILVPLSGAILMEQRIKYRSEVNPRVEPANSTPISSSGAFYFSVDPPSPDGLVTVPSIKEEVISDVEPFAGVGIDRDNAAVIAFVDAVLAFDATNPFGDAFNALVAAYRQSRV